MQTQLKHSPNTVPSLLAKRHERDIARPMSLSDTLTDTLTDTQSPLICVAVISGAFGIKGEVKLKPFTDEPQNCLNYGPLTDENGVIILTPISARPVKKAMAVICEQVSTREQAQALSGTKLYVKRSALPPPDEDDFYYSDLIGLQVKTTSGKNIGTIVAMHEFGANDMMEIKPSKKAAEQSGSSATWYHPFTKLAVPIVDIAKGRVIIAQQDVVNAKDDNASDESR